MKKWFFMVISAIIGITLGTDAFSATYDGTGLWEYQTKNIQQGCPGDPTSPEKSQAIIIQEGDTFSLVLPDEELAATEGIVGGATYTISVSFPEDGGTTTVTWSFTLNSDSSGSGSTNWSWAGGGSSCGGGMDFSLTRRQITATYDATGLWKYETSNHWSTCEVGSPEKGSLTITQTGNVFTLVTDGGRYRGIVSDQDYGYVTSYPEEGGKTTVLCLVTLTSNTTATGETGWYWTDLDDECEGGHDISMSKNSSPRVPYSPSPGDKARDVRVDSGLSWSGGDPDSGDTVSYDVYFGTSSNPPLVASSQPATSYDPGNLEYDTTYYWKIVATDDYGAKSQGPLWSFTSFRKKCNVWIILLLGEKN